MKASGLVVIYFVAGSGPAPEKACLVAVGLRTIKADSKKKKKDMLFYRMLGFLS
jgi:hypothetical protein